MSVMVGSAAKAAIAVGILGPAAVGGTGDAEAEERTEEQSASAIFKTPSEQSFLVLEQVGELNVSQRTDGVKAEFYHAGR